MTMQLLTPGQLFAERYRIERFLAQGGFGAVYVAEQLATEMRVAIKVLWPHVLQSKELVEKFKLEAKVAGRVNSDHIVRVVDAGFEAALGVPFMVMELLAGDDLDAVVERSGPVRPDLAALYLRQTASALDKAHGFRDRDGNPTPIIHRDLKPENLFLTTREDGTPHIKVLDFGIAKVLSSATKVSQQIKGTPIFMAYEQAAGGPLSPATDVWALGLIAFFLLTGKSYWRAANMEGTGINQLFGEILAHAIVPPSQRIAEMGWSTRLPPAFDAWFLRCVCRDPAGRFAAAGDAAAALTAALGVAAGEPSPPWAGTPPASLPAGFGAPAVTPANPSFAGPASAVIASSAPDALAVATLGSGRGLGSTDAGMGASQLLPVRKSALPQVVGAVVLVAAGIGGGAAWMGSRGPAKEPGAPIVAAAPTGEAPQPTVTSAAPQITAVPAPSAEPPPSASAAPSVARPVPRPSVQPKNPPPPPPTTSPVSVPAPRKTSDVYGER